MSRIQEKVKDLIEVNEYESIVDFHSEPSKTLSNYRFTDVTSELMAQWLDSVVGISKNGGTAKALAGYRGVGKSHFLATFGAILANPELRSRITDSHVSASAQVLMRRPYFVAYARRGSKAELRDELREGVANALSLDVSHLPTGLVDLVGLIDERTKDVPFIIIIDTAFERDSRVSRDDGIFLGELAVACKRSNTFIGVALDDDITDADGINLAISRTYTIDYLNQDHLNKIVNKHIFPKHRQSQKFLSDTYKYFREVLPGFRWSEQSFSALYPLHPSILELAQFVRLYAPHFALLSFASDAGARILGRPANSLIALDEVFDSVENSLRKSLELKEVFEVYDKISNEIVTQIPVMQRLQAKLILKALLILSLDGDGTNATEIAATMLIYNENEPTKAVENVEELLEKIVEVFPEDLQKTTIEGKETQYNLRVNSKDKLNDALDQAIKEISIDEVPKVLRKVASDKFIDLNLAFESPNENNIWTDCQINWRGSQRRCRIYWNWNNEATELLQAEENTDFLDLEIYINNPQNTDFELTASTDNLRAIWKPSELSKSDINTILSFYVLLNDDNLRNEFGDQIRTSGHKHNIEVEKIWKRTFLEKAQILYDSKSYSFDQIQENKQKIGTLLSNNLKPLFEEEYPEHPMFESTLGMVEVSTLVNDLFSGVRKTHEGVQALAEKFALPLGLVIKKGEEYSLESEENILRLPLAKKILDLVNANEDDTLSLKLVYKELKDKPFGLIREAQHLILSALVAQRKIEFVTTNGDRINRRSLDLKIIWDDIIGIAKPSSVIYNSQTLTDWAKKLTGLNEVQTIDNADDREKVKVGLQDWLTNWREENILVVFNELPDEILNTKIWYIWVNIEKSFGSIANSLSNYFDESISLEICLQRIADAFSNSEHVFDHRKLDLNTLKSFVLSANKRHTIWSYLAICEKTDNVEIEFLREKLFALLDQTAFVPNEENNKELADNWHKFLELFNEHFTIQHNAIMKSHHLQEKFDEIIKSDPWWEFSNLSKLPIFNPKHWKQTQNLLKKFRELDCNYDVSEMLKSHPFCACSFNLAKMRNWETLPLSLLTAIEVGRDSYRRTLQMLSETLVTLLESYVLTESDEELRNEANDLLQKLKDRTEIDLFTTNQLIILNKLIASMNSTLTLEMQYPQSEGLVNLDELRIDLKKWIDELPENEAFVKIR